MVRNSEILQKLDNIQREIETINKTNNEISKGENKSCNCKKELEDIREILNQNQIMFKKFVEKSHEEADELRNFLKKFAKRSENTADEFRDALALISMTIGDLYQKLDLLYQTIKHQSFVEDKLKMYHIEITKLSQQITDTTSKIDIVLKCFIKPALDF